MWLADAVMALNVSNNRKGIYDIWVIVSPRLSRNLMDMVCDETSEVSKLWLKHLVYCHAKVLSFKYRWSLWILCHRCYQFLGNTIITSGCWYSNYWYIIWYKATIISLVTITIMIKNVENKKKYANLITVCVCGGGGGKTITTLNFNA